MSALINSYTHPDGHRVYRYRHDNPPTKQAFERVKDELRAAGSVAYDIWLPETQYLPHVIHDDEHIRGAVFGRYTNGTVGRGVLVATDQRVIFLDKKPGFLRCDELTYMIVGGITFNKVGLTAHVILHTRLGDFNLRTFNLKAAEKFVDHIESECLNNPKHYNKSFDDLN